MRRARARRPFTVTNNLESKLHEATAALDEGDSPEVRDAKIKGIASISKRLQEVREA